ncbi:MAG: CaiB/BaiF CoA-transferase family protein [Novosphingobium sp.]
MGQGPLSGLRIVEFAGIGPGPFCGMLLSDLGAEVIRIDRKGGRWGIGVSGTPFAVTERGRRSVAFDLKKPEAIEACLRLIEGADALFEGFRPGVMERFGLGPDVALARNSRLVYGRVTGWGQSGPYSQAAGHDINYIAISGALDAIGLHDQPVPPLNLVGDFGGGALYLAFGLLAGVIHARETGQGQVVDVAMSDGAASLMAMFYGFRAKGMWQDERQANLLDGGAHFYGTYRCADGKYIAFGAIEPQFYVELRQKAGLTDPAFDAQMDDATWPMLRERMRDLIARRTQAEWCALFDGSDACFAPVLSMADAPDHPHNRARETFVEVEGVMQPAPAPRFSATPGAVQGPPPPGADNELALRIWGFAENDIAALKTAEAI